METIAPRPGPGPAPVPPAQPAPDARPEPDFSARATAAVSDSNHPGLVTPSAGDARATGTFADLTRASPLSGAGTPGDAQHPGHHAVIEGYDVVRKLGRGGMGVVYEGVQQATGRRVAIKLMLDSALESEAARKRFEREVEVVAGLQHPGIVSIVDSGVRRGRYFYVMEYVEGKPLDEHARPGEGDVRATLELLAQVCEAVDYAHQRGVLHRDLKPSNIIVDASGKPHLLDFGLAKRLDETGGAERHGHMGLTMSSPGQILGTVAYMSPEQAAGNADQTSVRTDVYSLGVILYEALSGRLPVLMIGSLRDVLRGIAEIDPPPPSSLRPRLGRDLDAILLKALEKAPERRYATAGALAGDIRLLLAGKPVEARRVGPAGRLWRWVQRNKAISAVSAGAAVLLIAVSTFLIVRVVQERDRANLNAAQNLENFRLAQSALEESRRNERFANENLAIVRGMLESADPDSGEITIRQMLDKAVARLDRSPPELDVTEASTREMLASVYRKFGEYDKALRNLTRALEIRERNASGPNAALADCLHNLAAVHWWKGDFADAERLYVRSLEMRRALYPADHRDIAMSLQHLAACRLRMGKYAEARQLYREALDMRRRLLGPEHEEVAQALNNLARSAVDAGDYDEAEALFRQALEMIVKLRGENFAGTAAVVQNLAQCLLEKGDASGARDAFARALAIRQSIYKGGHHLVASSLSGLAAAEIELGDAVSGEARARQAVDMLTGFGRTTQGDFADAVWYLGRALMALDRHDEAQVELRRALDVAGHIRPPAVAQVVGVEADLAQSLLAQGRRDEGLAHLESAYAGARRQAGDDSPLTARVRAQLENARASSSR